jgi:dTDP-glucose 4,6-dehydratase/UDP-glucose 4,6-dehydratase
MNYEFTNILITGGSGFIGSNYINHLFMNYKNKTIINIDRLDYCSDINNVNQSLNTDNKYFFYKTDISNVDFIYHIFNLHNIDTIVHFAAQTHVDNSFCNSVQFVIDNIVGTNYLLEVCRKYGKIQKFIHFSTDEVYGEVGLEDNGCSEKSLLNPTNPYAASKAGAEFMVRSYYYSFKLPVVITRCNNAYGPNQYHDKLIPKFINHLLNNEKCTIHGKGSSLRTFIHTDDISNAVDAVIKQGVINEVYNIGSFNELNVIQIYHKLMSLLKSTQEPNEWMKHVQDRNFNDMRYFVEIEKLEKLGWKECVDFTKGLNDTINWYFDKLISKTLLDDLKSNSINNISDFKTTLNFNCIQLSHNLQLNITHNLPKNYYDISYDEKKDIINNNLFLNWLKNKINLN